MTLDPQFKLLPVSATDDMEAMMEVGEAAFRKSTFHRALLTDPDDPAARHAHTNFLRKQMEKHLAGVGGHVPHYAKIVYTGPEGGESRLVAYVGLHAPGPKTEQGEVGAAEPSSEAEAGERAAEEEADRADAARLFDVGLRERTEKWIVEKTAELLGPDADRRLWNLRLLCTTPEFQRRGLGSRLVEWGVRLAEEDMRARPGTVEGIYVIATPEGLKSYLNAGLEEIGSGFVDFEVEGVRKREKYVWLKKDGKTS